MKRILIAATLVLTGAGQVLAADLPPSPAPPPRAPAAYVPPPIPVFSWTGIYVGINGGYGFGNSTWTDPAGNSTGSFTTTGFLVGGTLGANMQMSQFVFGVEGDIDWQNLKGSSVGGCGNLGAVNNVPTFVSCQTSSNWLGTIRGRFGYAIDRALIFGTGGGAFGDVIAGPTPSAPGSPINNSSTEFGWTAGAGLEYAFTDNITAKVEYLYVSLANGSCTTACTYGGGGGGGGANVGVSFHENLVRGGINFKFAGF
jgi:outer membrane immunogenic protein